MSQRSLRNRGFSLIELMVAMAVLAVGLIAMAPLVTMAISRGAHARKVTAAQHLAQDLLERLRAEIRYDGGVTSNPTLAEGDEWKFDSLPHMPDADEAEEDCQLGFDDGVDYDYGPFDFIRETHVFRACYALEAVTAAVPAVPAGTMRVQIRVLWQSPSGGWSSWSLTDLLVSGA